MFLKYIKLVLPELDVDGVEQCTYEMFAKKYIDEDININPSNKKVVANISGKNKNDIDKFKCSMEYKDMLDRFLALYFYSITLKPLMLGDFQVLSREEIAMHLKQLKIVIRIIYLKGYNLQLIDCVDL